MPQKFLDHLGVFAGGKEERGEGMPEAMDGEVLDSRFPADALEGAQKVPGVHGGVDRRGKDQVSPQPVGTQSELFLKPSFSPGPEPFHHFGSKGMVRLLLFVFRSRTMNPQFKMVGHMREKVRRILEGLSREELIEVWR